MMPSPSAHDEFAWVYNQHWGPYATEAIQILDDLLLNQLPPKANILDLCCGTGQLACELAARGYQVTGIDVSAEMLKFARENAPDAAFVMQDARHFQYPNRYDAVVSTYDGLNFIVNPDELNMVFDNIVTSLKPGGLFLFDVNTENGYLGHWEDGTFEIIEDDHVCIVRSDYDTVEQHARFDITIFRLHDTWHRSDLTFFQRCHSEDEILTALKSAGFETIEVWGFHDELGLGELIPESERVYFLCRRPFSA